jgi:hypothetical protein
MTDILLLSPMAGLSLSLHALQARMIPRNDPAAGKGILTAALFFVNLQNIVE